MNLSIQEIMAVIGNKELIIAVKDKEINELQTKIKVLTDKYEPKSQLHEVKKVVDNG
jgi:hypothetical protein